MAKVLRCGDLMPGCAFEAKGASEGEVLAQAAEHARTAHGIAEQYLTRIESVDKQTHAVIETNPDALRMLPEAVDFVRSFFDAGKAVAAICHGPWTIVESGAARGYRMTSWPSLKTDMTNAGGKWVDEEVVRDGPERLEAGLLPEDNHICKIEPLDQYGTPPIFAQ